MTMMGDLVDMVTICDRGDAMIINKEVRFERDRHHSSAECTITLGRAHVHTRESAGFMARLLRAHEDNAVRLEQMRRHYDDRESYCELTFHTDMRTYEWINQDEDGRRIGRVSSVNRPGRSASFREFRREILGEFRPTAAPPPEPRPQSNSERLRAEALQAMRMLGLDDSVQQRPNININHVEVRGNSNDLVDAIAYSMRAVMPDTAQLRGNRADRIIIDDPLPVIADPNQDPGTIRMSVDYGGPSVTAVNIVSAEYGSTLTVPKCEIGKPDSHQWVDLPEKGPSAKSCSLCKRVTGQFWNPQDYERFVVWLVTNTKILVCLWANDVDTMALRYSLIETDSSVKRAEEPSSTDTDARFALLELK